MTAVATLSRAPRALGEVGVLMPTPNVGLLSRVIAHIEANPEEWQQEDWRCETGMCVAGWAVQIDGGRWFHPSPDGTVLDALLHARPGEETAEWAECYGVTDAVVTAADRAQAVLGLTDAEADSLFCASNLLDDIYEAAKDILRRAVAQRLAEVTR